MTTLSLSGQVVRAKSTKLAISSKVILLHILEHEVALKVVNVERMG